MKGGALPPKHVDFFLLSNSKLLRFSWTRQVWSHSMATIVRGLFVLGAVSPSQGAYLKMSYISSFQRNVGIPEPPFISFRTSARQLAFSQAQQLQCPHLSDDSLPLNARYD